MPDLLIQEANNYCITITEKIIHGFGWHNLTIQTLSEADRKRLAQGPADARLNWPWAMRRYAGIAEDGILDISLKVLDYDNPADLHAVILYKYDARREEFAICMLENFIQEETTLTGKVLIIALVYSITFCDMYELDEIIIQDPIEDAKARYRSYGFWQNPDNFSRMSAEIFDIKIKINEKVSSLNEGDD